MFLILLLYIVESILHTHTHTAGIMFHLGIGMFISAWVVIITACADGENGGESERYNSPKTL